MKTLLATVMALVGVGVNVYVMIELVEIVEIVGAVRRMGRPEGSTGTIPWLPLFVVIPVLAIGGAIFVAERLFRYAKNGTLKDMLSLGCKVAAVQLGALWLGRTTMVLVRPVDRTPGNLLFFLLYALVVVGLWTLPSTPLGVKLFNKLQSGKAQEE